MSETPQLTEADIAFHREFDNYVARGTPRPSATMPGLLDANGTTAELLKKAESELEHAREKAERLSLPGNRDCGNCASYQDYGAPNNCEGCETDIQQNWTPSKSFRPAPTEERGPVVDAGHPPEGYRLAENGDNVDRQDLLNWIRGEGPWTQTFGGYGHGEKFKAGIHHPVAIPIAPTPTAPDWHARAEMAERLRVAEARVAMLERAARWALGEGDSDFPGPYAGYGAIGWRVKFRALLEGAQP